MAGNSLTSYFHLKFKPTIPLGRAQYTIIYDVYINYSKKIHIKGHKIVLLVNLLLPLNLGFLTLINYIPIKKVYMHVHFNDKYMWDVILMRCLWGSKTEIFPTHILTILIFLEAIINIFCMHVLSKFWFDISNYCIFWVV